MSKPETAIAAPPAIVRPAVDPNALAALATRIKANFGRSVQAYVENGRYFTEAKRNLSEGESFEQFCERDCGQKKATAYRLMTLWELFGDQPPEVLANFDISALYDLSGRTMAKPRAAALKLAKKGKYISHAEAERIINRHFPDFPCKKPKDSSTVAVAETVPAVAEAAPATPDVAPAVSTGKAELLELEDVRRTAAPVEAEPAPSIPHVSFDVDNRRVDVVGVESRDDAIATLRRLLSLLESK